MDVILEKTDYFIFTPFVYPLIWAEDDPFRQLTSLYMIIVFMCYSIYLLFSTVSYFLIFDQQHTKYSQFNKISTYAIFISLACSQAVVQHLASARSDNISWSVRTVYLFEHWLVTMFLSQLAN